MEGYIPKEQRKKILLICDDIRMNSGVAGVARDMIIGTAHRFNWVNVGGLIKHPDEGKRFDLSHDTNNQIGINDSDVILYPVSGYGNPDLIRQLIKVEKPDGLMIFTDPRYFVWLFQMESEIRKNIPLIYLNIWDSVPYPMWNKPFYESCDALFAISKQTENINKVVLGDKARNKIIKYIPHGTNKKTFFPITSDKPEYLALQEMKNKLFQGKQYDFVTIWNSRNIMRKQPAVLLEAWKIFVDEHLTTEQAKRTCLIMHTQPIDENGTNLLAVKEMLFGNNSKYNILFSENRLLPQEMNLLYNCADICALISSNEGWGLSLTEARMCGLPILANVQGGMQDQMRFEDEEGNWINFTKEFPTNHKGKYKNCGKWVYPVFPSNISIVGSVPTPYIYDERVQADDVAAQLYQAYYDKVFNNQVYKENCSAAYEWVCSNESRQTSEHMCEDIIKGIEITLNKFKPKPKFELIKVEIPIIPKHYNFK